MSEDLTRAIFSLAFVLLNWFLWEALGRCYYDFEKGKSAVEALFGASFSLSSFQFIKVLESSVKFTVGKSSSCRPRKILELLSKYYLDNPDIQSMLFDLVVYGEIV